MGEQERQKLIHEISAASFWMDELRLFLDTHPCNEQALTSYNDYAAKRQALVDKYVSQFGPLRYYDVNPCNEWQWVMYPWPWEGEC